MKNKTINLRKGRILALGFFLVSATSFGQDLERFYNTSSYLYGYKDPRKGLKGELKPAIKAQYVEAEENGFKNGSNIAIVRTRPKGAACCNQDKTGVIDKTGNEILPVGSIKAAFRHKNSGFIMFRLEDDDKRGLMRKDGEIIFPAEYKVMSLIGPSDWLSPDGNPTMLRFGKDGKHGLMQLNTEKKSPMQFDDILTNGYQESYAVKMNGKWAFINYNFEEITPYKYTNMGWSNDNQSFWCELNGTKKLINATTGIEGEIYTGEKPKENSGSSASGGSSSKPSSRSITDKCNFKCKDCSKVEEAFCNGSPSSGVCPVRTQKAAVSGGGGNKSHTWIKQ